MAQGIDFPREKYEVNHPLFHVFIRRTDLEVFRMVQGNNQSLSSPVNRIKITGLWASRALTSSSHLTLMQRLREYYHYFVFRSVLFSLDIAFWISGTKQLIKAMIGLTGKGEGFEDELERSMRGFAKSNMGLEISPSAFSG